MKNITLKDVRREAAKFGLEIEEDKSEPRFEIHAPEGKAWDGGNLHSLVHRYGSKGSYLPEWRSSSLRDVMADVLEYGPRLEDEPEE